MDTIIYKKIKKEIILMRRNGSTWHGAGPTHSYPINEQTKEYGKAR